MRNKIKKSERNLKVYKKFQIRETEHIKVPEIRLCGKWLHKTGFKCGQNITIIHEKGRIVIVRSS